MPPAGYKLNKSPVASVHRATRVVRDTFSLFVSEPEYNADSIIAHNLYCEILLFLWFVLFSILSFCSCRISTPSYQLIYADDNS